MKIIDGTWWSPIVNTLALLPAIIIKFGIPILFIVFLIMGIRYFHKKNKQ